jgi:peptidyl-dipeptidase A
MTLAQEHAPAKQEGSAPTIQEAKAFLDDAEARLFDLGNKAQRAAWVQENFITDDTNQIAADAGETVNTLTVELAKKAHRFDSLKLPPEMGRKMLLVKLSIGFPSSSNSVEQK